MKTRDITRVKKLEEAYKEVEEANRSKSEFLANISHEIRTPLQAVISFSQFGIEKVNSVDKKKLLFYYRQIFDNAQVLLTLVNELLDISKLEAGKFEFNFELVDLNGLINSVMSEFKGLLPRKNISFEYAVPPSAVMCEVDSSKIQQIIRNLLSNAIKFSYDGGEIAISLAGKNNRVRISVQDYGVGIPDGELGEVFNRFSQSSRTEDGSGGTGLGLAICEKIILAHKGRIWAESLSDSGVTFHFELPRNQRNR